MHVAFSREQEQKVYVTHQLKEQGADVWRILGKENGHLYVCGYGISLCSFLFTLSSISN